MFRTQRARCSAQRRRGAALVEAAIVLPIFFLAILAMVEFGRAMMVGQLVTNAAREGARRAILYGSDGEEVRTHVTEFLQNAADIDPEHVDMTITVRPGPDRTGSPPEDLADSASGDRVTVRVVVPWDQAGWGTLRWLGGKSFRGQATMRHE
ncbi:TadE family protein [Alienimonas chondri]|uniref:TadE-like domain-containing protein n=1 Tax=Alienimonas chondri TaxID=2681879 RepID=A0ABX1VE94_9PLAN|nr:TadE family protein [Alienimonas chondri]NNJ25746.1 hypothetical protein [Alienimonas chondri]